MKKILLSIAMSFMVSGAIFAQEVTVKAGTIIPLQIVNPVKAANVDEGQKVAFRVSRDVNVKGVTAIPYGTLVQGTVYEAKRSSWWGTKGRLGIEIKEIVLPNGTVIPLMNGDVYVTGKNQTPISIVVFIFTLLPFSLWNKSTVAQWI